MEVEKIEVELDKATVKLLREVLRYTHHPKETVLEVMIALWAYQEDMRKRSKKK